MLTFMIPILLSSSFYPTPLTPTRSEEQPASEHANIVLTNEEFVGVSDDLELTEIYSIGLYALMTRNVLVWSSWNFCLNCNFEKDSTIVCGETTVFLQNI